MDQEQLPAGPFDLLPVLFSPDHPAADSGRTFDLSVPKHCTPVPFSELSLYIPGRTTPVVGFDGGINLAALDTHRAKGLLCILQPYLDMAALDFVELFSRDLTTPVAFHTVTEDEAEKGLLIPLYISRARLPDGTIEPVFFRVSRFGGGTDETQRFRLKVDTVHPAGRDPLPSTPWHANLAPPEPELDFIDEEAAGQGVKVTIPFYPLDSSQPANTHRAVRDRIRLSIGGVIIEHLVTEGQAAGREPIVIWVYAGKWSEIGSGSHVCEYEIVDEVGNYSLGWSPAVLIEVELDDGAEPLLPECYIYEALDDILDADELNGEDATIEVSVHRFDYVVGDLIRVRARGRTQEGVTVIKFYEHPVTVTGRNARIPYPFEDFLLLVGGSVQLSYERIRTGVPNRRSRSIIVQVIGTPVGIGLSPPRVVEAPDGVLPPESPFVTVIINEYTGQDFFDRVILVLDGTYANGNGYYREVEDIAGNGDITFPLMNGANGDIAKLEGGTLRLYYTVTGAGGTRTSQDLLLDVGQPQASLPEPAVDQAPPPDYVFDPEQSLGDARILVRAHTDIREHDTIILHFEGSAVGGSAPPQTFKVLAHWVGRDLPFTVRRAYVLANLNGSARIYYTLTRDNERTRFSHAVEMKVGSPLELPVPEILEGTPINPTTTTIDPRNVLKPPVFTIRVRYAPMSNSDEIKPFFKGKLGLGTPNIPAQPGNASQGFVDFSWSNTAIAANLGQNCTVYFKVTRAGGTTESPKLTLEVEVLSPQLLDLVTVPEAAGGVIDAHGSNNVQALEYPFMRAGQEFWIDLKSRHDFNLRNGVPVSSAEFTAKRVVEPIPSSYLRTLTDGDNLGVQARVSLDGTGSKESAVSFVIPQYSIKKATGIVATINVGTQPCFIAISADGSRAYVTNWGSHTVSVIDTHSNRVIHTITGLNTPYRLTLHPDGSRLYVGNRGAKTISVISTTTHAIIQTIPGFNAIYGITFNTSGSRLYVSCNYDAFVYVHDTATGNRLNSLKVFYPTGLAFNPGETRLYAPSRAVITRINPAGDGSLIGDIAGTNYPVDIAFSPHNFSAPVAYITNPGLNNSVNTVLILDTTNDRIHKTLTGFSFPFGVAMNPITPWAYVTQRTAHLLSVIDTDKQEVIRTISGFNQPMGVTVTPNGLWAYVANLNAHTVSVVAL